jgi:pimeloyl-ACP methyl ester carboxylesterase
MPKVVVNGLRHNVELMAATGSAGFGAASATVVCVHGILTDSLASYYFTMAKPIADAGFDVVMYDLRGHGRTERPPSGYHLDDFEADLADLLARLEIDGPLYLVGNSFGGTIAFNYTVHHPDRVLGLASIESEPATDYWPLKLARNLRRISTELPPDEAEAWIRDNHGAYALKLARGAVRLLRATTIEWELPTSHLLTATEVRSIGCPVLAFYGSESELAPRAYVLEDLVRECASVVVQGQDHSVLILEPGVVRDNLLPWLANCERDRSPVRAGAHAR